MATKLKKVIAFIFVGSLTVGFLCVSWALWMCVSYNHERSRREEANMTAKVLANRMTMGVNVDESRKQLIAIIDGDKEFDAVQAIVALGETKDQSDETIDCILRSIKRRNVLALPREAARALIQIKPKREDIIDELILQLDSDMDVSSFSADALGSIGKAAQKALPKLREKMFLTNRPILSERCAIAVDLILKDIEENGLAPQNK
ncbi:MAG: hypothetical protein AB7S78_12360 [Candidatus Omnitrophota bacterium]